MTKSLRKNSFLAVFITAIGFLVPCFSAQAAPFDLTGTTIVDPALVTLNPDIPTDGILASAGTLGDTLTIVSGVTVGGVDFATFPYELFNRGIIDGSSPGVFCAVDCTINNDGFAAQILGDAPAAVHITGAGAAQVFNSGLSAEINGTDTGVQIEGGGLVENSGENAMIMGGTDYGVYFDEGDGTVNNTGINAKIIGGMKGVWMQTTGVADSVTQTVSNSGENSRIEGTTDDGVNLAALDSLVITQSVDNSGVGSIIISKDIGQGVDLYADGRDANAVDGTSIMQTVRNGGETGSGIGALIEAEGATESGILLQALDSLAITQTVDNTAADAIIRGSALGIEIFADGRDGNSVDGETISQTVTNSGAGAVIEGLSTAADTRGVEILAQDSLAITQLVDNSGAAATITGDSEGIFLNADGEDGGNDDSGDTITQTVLNSGADASINSLTDEGVEINAFDSRSITQLVDNTGAGAMIVGNDEGVELGADGRDSGSIDGVTIMQTVNNSGAGAQIEGQINNEGILMDAFDSLTITQLVNNSGSDTKIIGDDVGVRLNADGRAENSVDSTSITQTVNNSGSNAFIEGRSTNIGVEMDAGDSLAITQLVGNSGAGATIVGDGEAVYLNADGVDGGNDDSGDTINQTVLNSGVDASIQSHTDEGVEIDAFDSRSITQLVDNSGAGAMIIGNDEGVELGADGLVSGSLDGLTIMQTVNNSGAGAHIEGQVNNEGILMDAFDSHSITQLVNNSGSDATIIGDNDGVWLNADGLVNNTDDGESISQTLNNSGVDAVIEGRTGNFGVEMDAVDSLAITQTVTNSGSDARITGDYDGINLQADGNDNNIVDNNTISQTVTNSGAGALIEGISDTDDTRGVEMDAGDSLSITQLVDNSGDGAMIVGDSEGIFLNADGNAGSVDSDTISQTVLNSGVDSSINSHTDEGIEIEAFDSLSITQLVDNSGQGAKITGDDEGVELAADGRSSGSVNGNTISQTVNNSGAGALIEGRPTNEGIELDAFDALAITQTITNSGAEARILGDNVGISLNADGEINNDVVGNTIGQTITNSGMNARIESFNAAGIDIDALGAREVTQLVDNTGAGAEIIADSDGINLYANADANISVDQTVNNTGAGSIIKSQNGIGVDLLSDGTTVTTQTVNNTGASALIEGDSFGVRVNNALNATDMITVNNGNVAGDGASIIAKDSAGVGVSVNGNANVVNNLNSIIMGGSGGTGVQFLNASTIGNIFDNSGLVSCGVACTTAVAMGDGEDIVELRTGTDIRGDIDGEAGTDTVNLYGTGIFEHDFLNFEGAGETLNMEGVDWTLNSSGMHDVNETYINSGILKVNNGELVGDVFVEMGGTLGGNGLITGNVEVRDGGTLAPGNSIDTIEVVSQHFMDGSSLDIEFSDVNNDVVVVDSGATTIDTGATLNLIPFGNAIVDTRTFTFIDDPDDDTAIVGHGEFDTINAPLFFTADVLYEDGLCGGTGNVCVTLTRNATYASVGNTPNRTSMGALLDGFLASGDPEAQALLVELDQFATLDEFHDALDQLTPDEHATMIRLGFYEKLSFLSTLNGRLDIFNTQTQFASNPESEQYVNNPGVQLAMTGLDPVFLGKVIQGKTKKKKKRKARRRNRNRGKRSGGQWDVFVRPYGQFTEWESEDGYSGYDSSAGGATAGFKGWISNNINLGAAVGFSSLNSEFEGSDSEGDIDTFHGALFAGFQNKNLRGDAVFVYSARDFEMARRVTVGPINALARSEHDGEEITANVRAAYDIQTGFMVLSPEFSLTYSSLTEDSFTETGAGAANMTFAEADSDSLRTTLGVRAAFKSRLGNGGMLIVTDIHGHWAHEFLDEEQTITAQFAGFGSSGVDIINRPLSADTFIAGAGVLAMVTESFGASINYDVQIGENDFLVHTLSAGAEYRF